jgi:hypothetical protein
MGQLSKELPHYTIKKMAPSVLTSVGKLEVYFLPLHIKLSLIEIFVLAVDKDCEGFGYFRQKFPKISETKMKEDWRG